MSGQIELFHLTSPPEAPERISYTRRLTALRRNLLAAGIHPATRLALRQPPGETCGSCSFLTSHSHDRTWYKCQLVGITFGPRTDIRLGWPACERWEARP